MRSMAPQRVWASRVIIAAILAILLALFVSAFQ